MPQVRYQALGPLLAGEGSRAFLGLELIDGKQTRPAVIIWLPEEVIQDSERLTRVTRETAQATTLDHPNILKVIGLEKVDGTLARIVEFADGESLRLLLDTVKTVPPDVASYIVCSIATGVHFAHMAGNEDGTPLIHGDLRPETILVTHSGMCKVTGYGALTVAPREQTGGGAISRRGYAAPEQILGGREAYNRQTDVFLLGLILYECLTGEIPFADEPEPDQAIVNKGLTLEVESIPDNLRLVIARATAKRASDRYPTALDLKDALERAQPPLAAPDAFAAYLLQHFGASQAKRNARRQEIDNGIAELLPSSAPAVTAKPKTDAEKAMPAAHRPTANQPSAAAAPVAPKRRRSRRLPWPAAAGLLVGTAAITLIAGSRDKLLAAIAPTAGERQTSSPYPASATAATSAAAKGPAPKPSANPPDADRPAKIAAPVPAMAPPSVPIVEVAVTPPVSVAIDGKPAGRSPVTVPLSVGRHKLQLTDSKKGIHVTRNLEVTGRGRTRQQISIGTGFVGVTAPQGATIIIDTQRIGEAPISNEISVYEGSHRILVTLGSARWQQNFHLDPGEHATFNVEVTHQ